MTTKLGVRRMLLCVPATLLLIVAIALFLLLLTFDQLFLTLVAKNLAISPSSPIYENWLKPSVPIFFNVTLFNVTNPDEVLSGGRPFLQEVGPFVYRETRERFDVRFNNNDNTVRFKHRIFYHFDRNLSVDDPANLEMYTIDLYYLGLLAKGMGFMAGERGPFIKMSAETVMWGYYPSALKFMIAIGAMPDRKVGLFAANNGTNVIEFLVDTGAGNIKDIGKIYEVDGQKIMDVWPHHEANMINGTDGSLAPPGLDVGSTVSFHVPDICRSSTLYGIERRTTVHRKDIEVIAFSGTPPDPNSTLSRWRTEMFCDKECPPTGLLALAPCIARKGPSLPFFLSMPFFLSADPALREPFDGLTRPDEELHSTWVHIEPVTGAVLEAFKRIQFNVYLDNADTNMASPYYFPIGWLSETAVADEPALTLLNDKVFEPRRKLPFLIAIVSAVVFLVSLILFVILFVSSRRTVRAGKRSNVVVPAMTIGKGDPLDDKLAPAVWGGGDHHSQV